GKIGEGLGGADQSKARPTHFRSVGFAGLCHPGSGLFGNLAGIKLNHIPYKSSAQSVVDLIAGRLEMQFATIPPTLTNINAGQVRALATTGAHRVSALPDVPTMAEAGIADYEASLWLAVVA